MSELTRAVCTVRGDVQAVGFRWWVSRQADRLGLVGEAVNDPDGSVEVVVQGASDDVDALVALLREQPTTRSRPGRVESVDVTYDVADHTLTRFRTG